jgi:GNAT superfamily N-acetyltransferase
MDIIRAELKHLDGLAVLFDGYRQFYKQESDMDGAKLFLRERLTEGDSVIFLAMVNGLTVGFTQLYPSFSSVSMKRLWILNDLFVAQVARKRGVGEALLERAREFAVETNAKGLTLETAHDNRTAQSLYERMGWKRDESFHYSLLV